jgi:hypothetical protein
MDFKIVTRKLLVAFRRENVRYALMGGFALGLHGVGRATVDIDFLVHRDDLPKVDRVMQEFGYKCQFNTENVSQYISPLKIFGEVDFLHAFRKLSLKMLQQAQEKEIFSGAMKIRVLKPEDIIGLKVQAISNNPTRKTKDMLDIEALMSLYKNKLDWPTIKMYFSLFGMDKLYNRLLRKYSK